MALQLSRDVSFCRAGEALVFLDLRTDRYFRLGSADQQKFERFIGGAADEIELAPFVSAGILEKGAPAGPCAPTSATIASNDIQGLPPMRASVAGAMETAWHVMSAHRAIGKSRLPRTLAALARRKQGALTASSEDIRATALLFDANRSFVPIERRCLIDSIALLRMLHARNLGAELVFGVRIDPFAAHCWLQADNYILTCAYDEARGFTPILVR
ncbi:lasso peptide biosynthesis B2 protein [Sphingopyxis terrae]|uniref:Transglutaminase-like superfamily protein n=1 Tax=Sphingopyxis terrae subsp. ummariensis TaxID=429001 RepID=A0A1Y6FQT9_9SPHN|nr:lasso peptide biosynthesis B2 protein [Sphingopyxis terrae]PCF91417.1 hypothetical protein CPA46_08185 [Sphingopyxis terrae subsp. ummariensis]SMQ76606.1 Transglutaminase-like superfamily protein [Sphingopyxis terrae subsp. ummariensis]